MERFDVCSVINDYGSIKLENPAAGQWMYSWFSMTIDRKIIGFIMTGMKRTYCMKLKFKVT